MPECRDAAMPNVAAGLVGRRRLHHGAPETMLAPSFIPRGTCSTTWLGDHVPGARGVVHVAADPSAAATRSVTAARLAASTSLTSASDLECSSFTSALVRGRIPASSRIDARDRQFGTIEPVLHAPEGSALVVMQTSLPFNHVSTAGGLAQVGRLFSEQRLITCARRVVK